MGEQIVESPAVQAPVKVPVTTRDVLHRAADLLKEFGWCQKQYAVDADNHAVYPCEVGAQRFCAAGALARALFDLGGQDDVRGWHGLCLLSEHLGADIHWNDAPGMTAAQVVARLREAAERSEEYSGGDR